MKRGCLPELGQSVTKLGAVDRARVVSIEMSEDILPILDETFQRSGNPEE